MMCEYTLEVVATCPVDDKHDVYKLTIRSTRMVEVEDIRRLTAQCVTEKMLQEDLTERIHRALACEVETIGYHSGVRTKVTCGATA